MIYYKQQKGTETAKEETEMFKRENHIQVIYDGGTVKDFPAGCGDLAFDFMDMMEDEYGYSFEYKGKTLPGIEEWRDTRKNIVVKF